MSGETDAGGRREERYRTFVEQSAEGVWCFELDEPIPVSLAPDAQIDAIYSRAFLGECNDAMARMYGFSRASELIGARLPEFLPRTEANVAYLEEFIRSGYRLTDGESAEKDRHGNPTYFLNNLVGIVEDGRLLRAWGMQRDITDRKLQEEEQARLIQAHREALAERDAVVAQLDAIFAQAPFGMAFLDEDSRFVKINAALAEINGIPPEAHLGRTPKEMLPGILAKFHRETWREVFLGGEPLLRLELTGETPARPGLQRHWVEDWYPVKVKGRTIGVGLLVQEVTQQKKLLEERERAYRGAQEAIRLRDEFLSVAGHELKTPLTALQLQMETIGTHAEQLGNADLLQWLERANRSLRRILRLIDDLLDVTRIASGSLRLEPEDVDLVEVVRAVIMRSEGNAARAKSTITLTAPSPVRGYWDSSRLDQVADSLISNAIKYGMGRQIHVEVSRGKGGGALLVVRDQGMGIAGEDQVRIFERFERAVPGGHGGGLGLGLWIARETLEAMGGTIRVASRSDEGAEFRVSLPPRIARSAVRESEE